MVQAVSASQDTTPSRLRCSACGRKGDRYELAAWKSEHPEPGQETASCRSRASVIVRQSRSAAGTHLPALRSKGERCARELFLCRQVPLTEAYNLQHAPG